MKMNFSAPRPLVYSQPKEVDSCLLSTVPRLLVLRSEQARYLGCPHGEDVGVTPCSQHRGTQTQRLWARTITSRRVSDFAQPLCRGPSRS